ncbi:uncharacterized protein LOC142761733 [Rhipicephalus microplus]|uniref:uncharacterized protein LOC142761733 n=1 Tax=Rhipicephalus microplus TaxID=6941 RepID=UPI0018893599|nr:E3 ubiquitin-protein ligase RNF185-like [Rhipicephalus microplus]
MNRTGVASAFNCPVCLGPSQSLVFGLCQHFVCASCLYEPVDKSLRPVFFFCPICKDALAFPLSCPRFLDTTKEMMKIVGVVKCPRKRCGEEMWASDKKEHEKFLC